MGIRGISASELEEAVRRTAVEANRFLPRDVVQALQAAIDAERSALGRRILADLLDNARLASETGLPICQDTGVAVVFVEVGQDVHLSGGPWDASIHRGIARAYTESCYRASVVDDPFVRANTGDNTPAVIHYDMVPGDGVRLTILPKGFGSENMSTVRMLNPGEGADGATKVLLDAVQRAGPSACPPLVIGVGVGGTLDQAALLAKKALLRPLGSRNAHPHLARLEETWLASVNATGIGPSGYGGSVTALGLNVEALPTHIAGLPVSVALNCHAMRRASAEI